MNRKVLWLWAICVQLLGAMLGPHSVAAQDNPFLYLPFQAVSDVRGYYMTTMTSVFDHSSPDYSTDDRRIVMWNGGVFDDDCWSMDYDMIGDPTSTPGIVATPNPCLRQIQSFTDTNNEFPRQWYNGHDGYDWEVSGDVLAAAGGKVTWVGWNLAGKECLGYAVAIDHQNGYRTVYGHLRDGSSTLSEGKPVSVGQIIGEVGNTTGCGTSTGQHLHFTVEHWRASDKSWHVTDPFGWVGGTADPLFDFNEETSQNLWVGSAPSNYGGASGIAPSVPLNGKYLGGAFVNNDVSPVSPSITPASRTSINGQTATALVIDVSGSMAADWQGGIKIESAKQAAADVVTMIEQESQAGGQLHQVALVSFTTDANLESPLSNDYAGVSGAINRLDSLDSTNLGAGIEVANQALSAASTDAQKIVILLSDGLSNEGLSNAEILSGPVQAAADAGTCIYTIGFGDPGDLDEDLLRAIAARSGCGTYTYASAPADLARIYVWLRHQSTGDILDEFSGWIAQGETVQIGQVTVPANQGQLNVTLQWPGSRLDLIAKDPSGKTMVSGQPGVSLAQTARMVNLIVQNPAAGNWQFAAFGAEVPEQQLMYNLVASVRVAIATATSIPPLATATLLSPATSIPPLPQSTGGGSAGLLIALVVGALLGVPVVAFSARRRRQADSAPVSATAQLIGPSGERLPISDGAILGRDPDCAIRLLDEGVSRQHVQFRYAHGAWYLQDLKSSNGTFVNDMHVTATALRNGDRIDIGPFVLEFRIGR